MTSLSTNNLMMAILAMDSYNRGYVAGVNVTSTQLGDAQVGEDSRVATLCRPPAKGSFRQVITPIK